VIVGGMRVAGHYYPFTYESLRLAQYSNSATTVFDRPTNDTASLIQAAHLGLKRIHKPGFRYQRAGVLLPDLLPAGVAQGSLFGDDGDNTRQSSELTATVDQINRRYGNGTIRSASELLGQRWDMRRQFKSPSYTTRWDELLTIHI